MAAQGDRRIREVLDEALVSGPRDVLGVLAALRRNAASLLDGHEGRVHAFLHALLRRGELHVAGVGANGLARYAPGRGEENLESNAPSGDDGRARQARRVASGLRYATDRARVEADVRAHLGTLDEEGRAASFGSTRNVRHLLRRADRKRPIVCFPAGPGDYVRKFLVEEGTWILTAVVAFLLIRAFLAEVFYIPSSSMVPTLLEGDRVVVTKPGARGRMPERWSIVTFDREGTTFVKRVVGLGGERILLLGGDPYVDGELLPHPEDLREDLRTPYHRWDLTLVTPHWRSDEDDGAQVLTYEGPVMWSGGLATGPRPHVLGDVPLRDVYATLEAQRPAGGALTLELLYAPPRESEASATFSLRLDDGGWHVDLGPGGGPLAPDRATDAPTGRVRLELAYVDGELIARVAGAGEARMKLPPERRPAVGHVVRPRLRAEGGARLGAFALDRDHYYTLVGDRGVAPREGDEDPFAYAHAVPEGTVFLLGDNSYSSNDCRFPSVGDIPVDRLIGPVVLRIWPPTRIGTVR